MKKGRVLQIFALSVFSISLIMLLLATLKNEGLNDAVNAFSQYVRSNLSLLTNVFPISVFEIFLILSPVILFFAVSYILRARAEDARRRFRAVISVFLLLCGVYLSAVPKAKDELSKSYINTDESVSTYELERAALALIEELPKSREAFGTTQELSWEICESIRNNSHGYGVSALPRAKNMLFPRLFTRLHILGLYSFATGEILVNQNAPQYSIPFSIAHEYMHHLGAKSEADASFLAFLLCINSNSEELKYSAYMTGIEFIMRDIEKIDAKMYAKVYGLLPTTAKEEFSLWESFYSHDTFVGDASDKASSAYLAFADPHGGESYSHLARYITLYLASS